MDVRVCEKKCALKEECKEFVAQRDQQLELSPSARPESVRRSIEQAAQFSESAHCCLPG